jgi:hypothetical protein
MTAVNNKNIIEIYPDAIDAKIYCVDEQDTDEKNIFRYKLTDEFSYELYTFAKIHQYDDRETFKEEWNKWTIENNDIINIEVRRLLELNYKGNVLHKMFKSARYYYKNKKNVIIEPKERRKYITMDKTFIIEIDNHIQANINISPSLGFTNFCLEKQNIIDIETRKLCEAGLNNNEIDFKFKKTYKNRYFIIQNK